jgi:hypothetical protein
MDSIVTVLADYILYIIEIRRVVVVYLGASVATELASVPTASHANV